MKKENTLTGSISILIGIVIAILALVRGKWQTGLLITVFLIWGVWAVVFLLLPRIQRARRCKQRQQQRQRLQAQGISQPIDFQLTREGSNPTELLLLRHVNHRISAYLRSTYGEVTWDWCEKYPEKLAVQGGIGRIRIYGASDFDHADVTLDRNAGIRYEMLRAVSLEEKNTPRNTADSLPPNKQPVDPQIWYETQGRKVLETLVADLNSRGHSQLLLGENGDISIRQDQEDTVKDTLENFPARVYWPRLIQVLESEGLAAEATTRGITVSW